MMLTTISLATALLYPSVVKTGENLLSDEKWKKEGREPEQSWSVSRGGPFSPDEPAWTVKSSIPVSAFWKQTVPLQVGHRYLVGMWMRRENARAFAWCFGKRKDGRPFDERIYLFGGFNECLTPYVRPQLQERIGGDPKAWKLMYRPVEIEDELAYDPTVYLGIYMSTGSLTFAHPFLVDVTGQTSLPLTAELTGGKKASSMSLIEADVQDVIWTRKFESPAETFSWTSEDVADALRGYAKKEVFCCSGQKVEGHILSVTYDDGTSECVFAPQENMFVCY